MILFTFAIVFAFFISCKAFSSNVDDNDYNDINTLQVCVCVPYWQCKEDFSGLIEEGVGIVDIRSLLNSNQSEPPCTGDFDVCCKIECGKRRSIPKGENKNIGFRIIGADNDATFGEFPWMLGVLQDKTYKCGASLIHPQVAVTAAHCVGGRRPYKVRAGEWNWLVKDEPLPHQDRITKKVVIHPQYHSGTLSNDIALLVLREPFKLMENVGVICLPPKYLHLESQNCVATGWGKNSHKKGSYQTTLKKVTLPLVPRSICLRSLQEAMLGPSFILHNSFLCAGGVGNKDTCKGDGGSPLICPVEGDMGKYQQVGIVSWGLTCGVINTPGVYVNVLLFRDWIDNVMTGEGFDTNVYTYY
ncbi:unnamed protein product [Brassicogethes aeneus]|uniref:Phenoloxidase-activating factor 2 n=1 Tax=Brassicogethes aeneus TaxID=1431903 RepID=A0A9P0BAQ8_BRAAE|nr:unnamed protein product [Brassicogethes aeneus]